MIQYIQVQHRIEESVTRSHLPLDIELQALLDGTFSFDVQPKKDEVFHALAHVRTFVFHADKLVANRAPVAVGEGKRSINCPNIISSTVTRVFFPLFLATFVSIDRPFGTPVLSLYILINPPVVTIWPFDTAVLSLYIYILINPPVVTIWPFDTAVLSLSIYINKPSCGHNRVAITI